MKVLSYINVTSDLTGRPSESRRLYRAPHYSHLTNMDHRMLDSYLPTVC